MSWQTQTQPQTRMWSPVTVHKLAPATASALGSRRGSDCARRATCAPTSQSRLVERGGSRDREVGGVILIVAFVGGEKGSDVLVTASAATDMCSHARASHRACASQRRLRDMAHMQKKKKHCWAVIHYSSTFLWNVLE